MEFLADPADDRRDRVADSVWIRSKNLDGLDSGYDIVSSGDFSLFLYDGLAALDFNRLSVANSAGDCGAFFYARGA